MAARKSPLAVSHAACYYLVLQRMFSAIISSSSEVLSSSFSGCEPPPSPPNPKCLENYTSEFKRDISESVLRNLPSFPLDAT